MPANNTKRNSPEYLLAVKAGAKRYETKMYPCVKDSTHRLRYTHNNICCECTSERSDRHRASKNPNKRKKLVEQEGEFYQPPINVVVLPYHEPSLKERLKHLRFPGLSGKLE
jgi:hypothetical protein